MNCLILGIALAVIQGTFSHPQCLDGKPPFVSSPQLEFCTEYTDVGCCTALEDSKIKRRYQKLKRLVSNRSCHMHLKSLLCQSCSPYAAHLFNYESTGVASPTPGLCSTYCTELYDSCGPEALTHLSDETQFETAVQTRSQFCEYSRLADEDYCYPDLKTNPVLTDKFTRPHNDSEGCMCLQKLADGHGLVTFIEANPAATHLMYVGEQNGKIHVYVNGVKRKRLFLDLSQVVLLSAYVGDERGLLGMAFHPRFSTNRRFYLYYVLSGEQGQTVRISQWVARGNYAARKSSEKVLMDIPQPYFNHNGGQLLFGDDGYLYIFTGDGGSAGDPQGNSQNLNSLMGKALRIDVNHRRRGRYTIPSDNPFQGGGGRAEIYAYGLRNPWRCSKDKGDLLTGDGRGRIFCGDVGQDRFEEIDIIVKGGNYGWAAKEGFNCFNSALCGSIGPEELPIYAYGHSYGKSITGGYMYRGCEYATFNGSYVYGDFTSGRMFKLEEKRHGWQNTEIVMCSTDTCTGNWVSTYGKGITTFGTNSNGDILMASSSDDSAFTDGSTVYKLIMQPFRREDPTTCNPNAEVSLRSFTSETEFSSIENKDEAALPSPALSAAVTEPGPPTIDFDIVYDPYTAGFSRRQRHLAELIAQYKALIEETEADIREKERLIAAAGAGPPLTTQISAATVSQHALHTTTSSPIQTYKTDSWHLLFPQPTVSSKLTTSQAVVASSPTARTTRTLYNWQTFIDSIDTSAPPPSTRSRRIYSWHNPTTTLPARHDPTTSLPARDNPTTSSPAKYNPTTSSPARRTYSWQRKAQTPSSRVIVKRIKSESSKAVDAANSARDRQVTLTTTTATIAQHSEQATTISPYFYLPTVQAPATPLYPWVTIPRRLYGQPREPITFDPLTVVTSYPLPDYLLSDAVSDGSTTHNLNSYYLPPPRRLIPTYRYQEGSYYSDGSLWPYPRS